MSSAGCVPNPLEASWSPFDTAEGCKKGDYNFTIPLWLRSEELTQSEETSQTSCCSTFFHLTNYLLARDGKKWRYQLVANNSRIDGISVVRSSRTFHSSRCPMPSRLMRLPENSNQLLHDCQLNLRLPNIVKPTVVDSLHQCPPQGSPVHSMTARTECPSGSTEMAYYNLVKNTV